MKIIASTNLKGGVGKTTLAINLGSALAESKKVVVVDADPQGTSTTWAIEQKLPVTVLHWTLNNPRETATWLEKIHSIKADIVIIDLPPHLEVVTEAAMVVADLCIIPVTPSGADLLATKNALALLKEVRQERKNGKPLCLLLPSKVDIRTSAGREIEVALRGLGEPIGPSIGQRSVFVDCYTVGEWVGVFDPKSKGHEEIQQLADEVKKCLEIKEKI